MAEVDDRNGGPPRVDPTILTRDLVNAAKEDMRREMASEKIVAETNLKSLRIEVMSEIRRVNDVTDQKFNSVRGQFEERDVRVEQTALSGRISLDAALAAAKEAVGEQNKSNTLSIDVASRGTTKQIDGLQELFTTAIKSVEDKASDLKGRLDRGEGGQTGERYERAERHANANQYTNVITAVIIAVAAIAATLIGVFH